MPEAHIPLLKPSRRRFLFMSAGIVAATSLMKISTAAQAFTTEDMTYKAIEVMPDLGPMAMTIAGKDYVYDETLERWIIAPNGTPNWREFLAEETKQAMREALGESIGVYAEYNPDRTAEQIAWDRDRKIRLQKELTRRMLPTHIAPVPGYPRVGVPDETELARLERLQRSRS